MNRMHLFVMTGGAMLAAAALWLTWHPVARADKPHSQWQRTGKGYELVVIDVDAKAELPRGVVAVPSPVLRTIEFRRPDVQPFAAVVHPPP